jgi:hypothetical protein
MWRECITTGIRKEQILLAPGADRVHFALCEAIGRYEASSMPVQPRKQHAHLVQIFNRQTRPKRRAWYPAQHNAETRFWDAFSTGPDHEIAVPSRLGLGRANAGIPVQSPEPHRAR